MVRNVRGVVYAATMNNHKKDTPSGGCVCGSAWSTDYSVCMSTLTMSEILDSMDNLASSFFASWDADDDGVSDFDCYRGHRGCTRCDRGR